MQFSPDCIACCYSLFQILYTKIKAGFILRYDPIAQTNDLWWVSHIILVFVIPWSTIMLMIMAFGVVPISALVMLSTIIISILFGCAVKIAAKRPIKAGPIWKACFQGNIFHRCGPALEHAGRFVHAQARLQLRKAFPSAILNNADISGRLRLCARAPWLIKLMTL